MKIDRHSSPAPTRRVKHRDAPRRTNLLRRSPGRAIAGLVLMCAFASLTTRSIAADPTKPAAGDPVAGNPVAGNPVAGAVSQSQPSLRTDAADANIQREKSEPLAVNLLRQVLKLIVHGPAFDAKVRETVWTTGREVVGVGTYEQAGGGSGQFNLQITMHDGDGKHRLQQISDGRLAWTRTEIAGVVSLRRVDVGRLDEWVRGVTSHMLISPRLRVGALAEMLSTIERDHVLGVVGATLKGESVWVVTGSLREDHRKKVLTDSGRTDWPLLYPTRVRIAVKRKPDPETGFGALMPMRIEFWSDPVTAANDTEPVAKSDGRLITLIELYSIRPISPPSPERFRFENHDAEVNFTNETDRYIQLYGVQLTERQRRQLRR